MAWQERRAGGLPENFVHEYSYNPSWRVVPQKPYAPTRSKTQIQQLLFVFSESSNAASLKRPALELIANQIFLRVLFTAIAASIQLATREKTPCDWRSHVETLVPKSRCTGPQVLNACVLYRRSSYTSSSLSLFRMGRLGKRKRTCRIFPRSTIYVHKCAFFLRHTHSTIILGLVRQHGKLVLANQFSHLYARVVVTGAEAVHPQLPPHMKPPWQSIPWNFVPAESYPP